MVWRHRSTSEWAKRLHTPVNSESRFVVMNVAKIPPLVIQFCHLIDAHHTKPFVQVYGNIIDLQRVEPSSNTVGVLVLDPNAGDAAHIAQEDNGPFPPPHMRTTV